MKISFRSCRKKKKHSNTYSFKISIKCRCPYIQKGSLYYYLLRSIFRILKSILVPLPTSLCVLSVLSMNINIQNTPATRAIFFRIEIKIKDITSMEYDSKIEQIFFFSEKLKKEMGINIYLPSEYKSSTLRFPVLYFLHGRSGNENIIHFLDIKSVTDKLISSGIISPLIIVCPRMENSRGLNSSVLTNEVKSGGQVINVGQYENYFIKEVIPYIDSKYNTRHDASGRYVGGASAGGYAALNYGLKYPELFSRIGGHMPALELQLDQEDLPYFGNISFWRTNNPIDIAKECKLNLMQEWYLDAGNKDEGHFYEGCNKLYQILKDRGANVQNHVFAGHHDITYLKSNLEKYLIFYNAKKG